MSTARLGLFFLTGESPPFPRALRGVDRRDDARECGLDLGVFRRFTGELFRVLAPCSAGAELELPTAPFFFLADPARVLPGVLSSMALARIFAAAADASSDMLRAHLRPSFRRTRGRVVVGGERAVHAREGRVKFARQNLPALFSSQQR